MRVGLLASLLCSGCLTLSTSEVRVRDPAQVVLERPNGDSLLPSGTSEAVVERGEYWYMLSREPYEVRASREANGAISLRCEACDAPYPLSGVAHLALLDETGRTLAWPSWHVDIGTQSVAVSYDPACMVAGPHGSCRVPVHARLTVPTTDVVEVRRRVEPIRIWGYLLFGVGVLAVGSLTLWALTPSHGDSVQARAPWAAAVATPFAAVGGIGLWHILTPAKEQVWTPPAGEAGEARRAASP